MVYLRRFISQIAEMLIDVTPSDPDTTPFNLA